MEIKMLACDFCGKGIESQDRGELYSNFFMLTSKIWWRKFFKGSDQEGNFDGLMKEGSIAVANVQRSSGMLGEHFLLCKDCQFLFDKEAKDGVSTSRFISESVRRRKHEWNLSYINNIAQAVALEFAPEEAERRAVLEAAISKAHRPRNKPWWKLWA